MTESIATLTDLAVEDFDARTRLVRLLQGRGDVRGELLAHTLEVPDVQHEQQQRWWVLVRDLEAKGVVDDESICGWLDPYLSPWSDVTRGVWGRWVESATEKGGQAMPAAAMLCRLLTCEEPLSKGEAGALLQSRHLSPLTQLNFSLSEMPDTETFQCPNILRALAEARHLEHITHLHLISHHIDDDTSRMLATATHLRTITHLDLTCCVFFSFFHLPHLAVFDALEHLVLSYVQADGGIGAEDFADAPHLHALRVLELASCELGDKEVRAIADSPHLARLERFHLDSNDLSDVTTQALGSSPFMTRVNDLSLAWNAITDAGLEALGTRSAEAAPLRALDLQHNRIGDGGVRALTQSSHIDGITRLNLAHNNIGEAGAKALAECGKLGALVELNLNNNHIGDEGAKALAGCAQLGALGRLELEANGVGDDGVKALVDSPHLTSLYAIAVRENPIGIEGERAMKPWFERRLDVVKFYD